LNRVHPANLQNTSGYKVSCRCYCCGFGWPIAQPQSHYFGLGKISADQLKDYAKRKGMSLDEAERWLRPVLE